MKTGVIASTMGPELRTHALFLDRFVYVVRMGHSLGEGKISPAKYAADRHIGIVREGLEMGPIDEARSALGLERAIATTVGGFSTAVTMARASDLIASDPTRHAGNLRAGRHTFLLPFSIPEFTVSSLWHPRFHAYPAHRWLRGVVLEICAYPITAGVVSPELAIKHCVFRRIPLMPAPAQSLKAQRHCNCRVSQSC